MFQGSFKDVSRKFQECFKEDSRVLQVSFWEISGVSRKFQVVLRRFQGYLKEV